MVLGYTIEELESKKAFITAKEIGQQPKLWLETLNIIKKQSEAINNFWSVIEKENIKRVILTGAGTSAFVGETAAPYLNKKLGRTVESIATTDLVTSPENYLYKDVPTLLISYARSGNSPESVVAVELAERVVDNLYQIVITCNPEGKLAERTVDKDKNLVLLMPKASNDQGFAMTGSFTCMLLSTLLIFDMKNLSQNEELVKYISANGDNILSKKLDIIKELSEIDYDRVAFLGSSVLKGIAQEASLKVLELAAGEVAAVYNSSLGFRHGPKSIVNDNTLIFSFLSDDPYTRQYEIDLLKEMKNDGGGKIVIGVSSSYDKTVADNADYIIVTSEDGKGYGNDVYLALNYIIVAQIFALYRSMSIGITPDNPSPNGLVNRVVRGVNIYPFK